ncbi:THAP domain-containing protein 1-like [Montipora capricornis]|uniref:THAP domain-containing protein 1-like n=1 Tax=Montipora capricornis TaxID=246305 RepID=UPI0035F11AB4
MPKRCVAAGCSNERNLEEGISLHKLPFHGEDRPEAKKRREKWVDFVQLKRAKWEPSQSSVLCSEHFKREDFTIREAIASSFESEEQSAEEMAFPSSSSLGTSNEPLPQSETDGNYLTKRAISKEVNISNEEVMEEDLLCLNCHNLEKENRRLRNRIVTLEEQVSRRKRESRSYNPKY